MNPLCHEQLVEGRLLGRPYLVPVFTSPTCIPERLRELNPAYYVVLNVTRVLEKAQGLHYREWTEIPPGVTPRWNAWYEVRKLTAPLWMEAALNVPFGVLDTRAISHVLRWDTEVRGTDVIRDIEDSQQQHKNALARQRRNTAEAMARDVAWGRTFFGPGGPTQGHMRTHRPSARQLYVPA